MRRLLFLGLIAVSHLLYGQSDLPSQMTLDLQQCIDLALERNLNIQKSTLDLTNAEINRKQAQYNRLPNLNVGSSGGRRYGRSLNPVTNQFEIGSQDFISPNASANVTIFNGLTLSNQVKQGVVNEDASEFDLEKAKNDVMLNVVNHYMNVILNRELVQAAQLQSQSNQEQLERTRKLVVAGSLPITNQLDLESQLATSEVDVINAENSLSMSMLSLKQAMLLPSETELDIVVPEVEIPAELQLEYGPDETFALALETQPDVKSADLRVESASLGVRVAKGAYSPSLSFGAQLSTNYSNLAQQGSIVGVRDSTTQIGYLQGDPSQVVLQTGSVPIYEISKTPMSTQFNNNLSKNLFLSLNIPIFNRFATRSSVQQAVITQRRAEITARETRNALRQNIETAYNNANAGLKTYNANLRQVQALEQSFKNAESRYNFGAGNFVDYQVASNNLFRARSNLVNAKYTYLFRLKILEFYQGKELTF